MASTVDLPKTKPCLAQKKTQCWWTSRKSAATFGIHGVEDPIFLRRYEAMDIGDIWAVAETNLCCLMINDIYMGLNHQTYGIIVDIVDIVDEYW